MPVLKIKQRYKWFIPGGDIMQQNIILLGEKTKSEIISGIVSEIIEETGGNIKKFMPDDLYDMSKCIIENTADIFVISEKEAEDEINTYNYALAIRKYGKYKLTPIIIVSDNTCRKIYLFEEFHIYGFLSYTEDNLIKKMLINIINYNKYKVEKHKLKLKKDGIIYFIDIESIVYIETCKRTLSIYLVDGKKTEIPYYSFNRLMNDTGAIQLVQCSRNIMVNEAYIKSVDVINRYIELTGNRGNLSIGMAYKKNFLSMVK